MYRDVLRSCVVATILGASACHGPPVAREAEPAAASPAALSHGARNIPVEAGVALHVDVEGSGPPCLYVHGGPGQGVQSFQHMRGDALEGFLTMIYVDQRGSGQSDSAADYHLDRVVDDLEAVRRALGAEQIYLLAHSFGGIIAFRYAEKYPAHVRGLILANATLSFTDTVRAQLAYLRAQVGDTGTTPDDASWDALRADYSRVRDQLAKRSDYVKVLAEDLETMRTLGRVDADPPRKQDLGNYVITDPRATDYLVDFTPRTANVGLPVLIITGDRDHAIGPDHFQRFHFPHQTVQHIDGSHLLYYENTAAFAAAVQTWVTATGAR